nr:hypothetical protein [Tanacetum cinerariifolium]
MPGFSMYLHTNLKVIKSLGEIVKTKMIIMMMGDDKRTKYDSDEIRDPNLTNIDQTKYKEDDDNERVTTPSDDTKMTDEEKLYGEETIDDEVIKELYDDVNVNLGNYDTKMTDANQGGSEQQNVSQELGFEQEEEDAHVTLTSVPEAQKADKPVQSSYVSFDFRSKFLNIKNPSATSPVVVNYDQHAYFSTSHWVARFTIMKKYDYGHLEEIEVHRDDQQLYTFKEDDFKRLRLQDIKDMLILLVQQKLTNLTIDERYDLNVALRMFTRRIVIQRWVEDLQLGVESYKKKLNLTKPDTFRSNLRNKTAYTSHSDPHGIMQNQRDLPRDIPLDSVEVLSNHNEDGNPVKEILLKLNLPNHKLILTDSKMEVKVPDF